MGEKGGVFPSSRLGMRQDREMDKPGRSIIERDDAQLAKDFSPSDSERVKLMRYEIPELIEMIEEPNRTPMLKLYLDEHTRFTKSPGSKTKHQAWRGGYWDHITEIGNIAVNLYPTLNSLRQLPFSLSDSLLVLLLHDIEKPWKYVEPKVDMESRAFKDGFRRGKITEYSFQLTDEHWNGMKYVEGEIDDYSPTERKMGPLAAFCHLCDVTSARIWFDYPLESNDPWTDAIRIAEF